jgi:hypothetical protein
LQDRVEVEIMWIPFKLMKRVDFEGSNIIT